MQSVFFLVLSKMHKTLRDSIFNLSTLQVDDYEKPFSFYFTRDHKSEDK